MSEKQVNIKITANTKDFNSAIDKAQKQIESLGEALDSLTANKIGDKLADQFGNLTKVAKELEDQIATMLGAFDKLDKAKLDKTEDELEGATEVGEKLNETLEKNTDSMNELGKTKLSGLDKEVKSVTDRMEKLQDAFSNDSARPLKEMGEVYRDAKANLEKLTQAYEEADNKQKELAKTYEKSQDDLKELADKEKELTDAYNKANKELEDYKATMIEASKPIEDYNNKLAELEKKLRDANANIDEQEQKLSNITKEYDDVSKEVLELSDSYDKLTKDLQDAVSNFSNMRKSGMTEGLDEAKENCNRLALEATELDNRLKDLKKTQETLGNEKIFAEEQLDNLKKGKEAVEQLSEELKDQRKAIDPAIDAYNEMGQEFSDLKKKADDAKGALDGFYKEFGDDLAIKKTAEQLDKIKFEEAANEAKKLKEQMEQMDDVMSTLNSEAQKQAEAFDEQYKAYERLSKKVDKYISDETKAIALRGQVADSFKKVANAMEGVYADSKKFSNMDKVNKTLQESKQYLEDFNLVSFDNVNEELDRLNKRIEDTIEKQKRYKAISQEFGSDDSKMAYGLEKQAEALREWAESADFVIEAADKLTHAWGDVSAAGEDHVKIRERSKYIDEYGKSLQENITHIQNYYHELETLDDIYKECTDEQRAIIDDYKTWEKNKEKLDQYNQAIRDYLTVIKESGGQISDKFKDDLGNFDVKKFIENYEKFGEANNVLKKSMEALKVKTLASVESLIQNAEANKKAAKEARDNAKAALEQAKAEEKAARTQEERAEAAKKVAKAEEELAEAKRKVKDFDKDLLSDMDKLIKKYNEGAEAARKLGINMKDLAKTDISKLAGGKPFASLLDSMKTFGDDLPKTFSEYKRQIQAIFKDMDGLDFGSVLSGLKDLGGGILDALPTKFKLAAAAALGLYEALKKCAEVGINQFTRGMDTISGALSGIMGVARSIGTEVRDAFENITGMQLDASSLMEIPVAFESQMQRVKAIGEMTEEEFKRINDLAIKLGADTVYGATEVGEAMEYMGQAGWDSSQIEKGVEAVLDLATVADMDLGKASETVTDIINAFKNAGKNSLTADDARGVVDLLNTAAVKTSTSIEKLKSAFSNVAPIAGSFKMNVKDLVMALGLMGDQGVKGAKAGTALKNVITNINRPTEEQLAIMKKYNLLGARKAMIDGDLLGGIRLMKQALDGLSDSERNQVIEAVAGQEALSGVSALLNSSTEDINELETAMNNCTGSAHNMAEEFKKTVKGALDDLSGSIESTLLKIFNDEVQEKIAGVINQISEFFNILNGFEESSSGLTGIAGAMEHLEETTRGWGDAIEEGLTNAIGAINDFINSTSFDNLLQAGTNIINGIADGIKNAAEDGTLGNAISTAIEKIATWFSNNLNTIVDVGKQVIDAISQGISDNQGAIGEVVKSVIEMQTTIDTAVAKEKWKFIGANLGTFIIEGFTTKVKTFFSGVGGFLEGLVTGNNKFGPDDVTDSKTGEQWTYVPDYTGMTGGQWIKTGQKNGQEYATGVKEGVSSKKEDLGNTINQNFKDAKVKTDTTASEIGQGISDNILAKLETMDTGDLKALRTEMESLQKTVTSLGTAMTTSFTQIQDSARTSFVGLTNIVRNQMVNVTNIIRNQMVNSANIVRNQCVNMANIFRNQFVSMANVTRNQMVNVSNIIRNQAVNWANIISNQSKNARDNLTRQFMSMAKVVATQMSKCLSSVKTYMNQIASATKKNLTMNLSVNRSVSTSYISDLATPAMANALYAANAASTLSVGNNTGALAYGASSAMSTGTASGSSSRGMNEAITLEIPVMLDGKQVARATAKYVDNELKMMTKRENRKRGAK